MICPETGGSVHKLRDTFQTVWSDYPERVGQGFTILWMIWTTPESGNGGDNAEPLFRIRFGDGTEIVAHCEEVFEGWIQPVA